MFSVLLPDPQVGEYVVGPRTFNIEFFVFFFITVQELLGISILQFVGHLLCGSMVGLMTTSSKRTNATIQASQICCNQRPYPCGRPLLTHASTGETQTLKGRSGSICGGHCSFPLVLVCTRFCFCPSEHLWWF